MNTGDVIRSLSADEKAEIAAAAGTTVDYLYQLAGGHRKASPDLAKRLEEASGGRLGRHLLRPDLWPAPVMVTPAE